EFFATLHAEGTVQDRRKGRCIDAGLRIEVATGRAPREQRIEPVRRRNRQGGSLPRIRARMEMRRWRAVFRDQVFGRTDARARLLGEAVDAAPARECM